MRSQRAPISSPRLLRISRFLRLCGFLRPCRFLLIACCVAALAGSTVWADAARIAAATDPIPEAALPDAPGAVPAEPRSPALALTYSARPSFASDAALAAVSSSAPAALPTPAEIDAGCQSGALRGKVCRVHWLPLLWESFEATAIENGGNIAFDQETRHDLLTNPYWSTYAKCVVQYRYRQWSDDTPFIVHDIGHPMQGATVYAIWDQNDPKIRGMLFENSGRYWRAHLKAMAVVTLYEIQWKIGPISEAAIGNSGLNTYYTPSVVGRTTNETGFQDFVITPVYGLGWHVMEDLMDRFVMPHIWKRTHNRLILTALVPLTATRDAANILRYKPFYYRDYPITPLR